MDSTGTARVLHMVLHMVLFARPPLGEVLHVPGVDVEEHRVDREVSPLGVLRRRAKLRASRGSGGQGGSVADRVREGAAQLMSDAALMWAHTDVSLAMPVLQPMMHGWGQHGRAVLPLCADLGAARFRFRRAGGGSPWRQQPAAAACQCGCEPPPERGAAGGRHLRCWAGAARLGTAS